MKCKDVNLFPEWMNKSAKVSKVFHKTESQVYQIHI